MMDLTDMLNCFKEMKLILDKSNITFWIDSGTLLGAIREGKMIENDYDIDIATLSETLLNKIDVVSKKLYELGYDVYITKEKLTIKKEHEHISLYMYDIGDVPEYLSRTKISKRNFLANIILYGFLEGLTTPYKDMIHHSIPKKKLIQKLKRFMMIMPSKPSLYNLLVSVGLRMRCMVVYKVVIPASYVDKLGELLFYGIKVNIPWKSEEYLECMYGENWRIPDKNWDTWSFHKQMKNYSGQVKIHD